MIRVDENYVICGNAYDYVAYVDTGKTKMNEKTSKEEMVTKFIGFYSSIESCIHGIRDFDIRQTVRKTDMTLSELVEKIQETNKHFTTCFDSLKLKL